MGTRARSGPSWVQAWRAAGQMPAPPLPRPPSPGFPPLENEPERWPASRTRRDNAGTCTPEVDAAGASGGPSYRAPRNRNRRAPSLRGGASASPAPSSQELPPARPPAQLQRVTRGARLRRPPWAGADCPGGRERRHGGGGVGGARAHAELRAAGAARLGQRAGGGSGLRGLRLGACSPRPGRARAPGAARAAAAGPRRARLDRAALGGHLAPLSGQCCWGLGRGGPGLEELGPRNRGPPRALSVRERWEWGWMRGCDRAGEAWDVGTPTRVGCSRWGPDPVSEAQGGPGRWEGLGCCAVFRTRWSRRSRSGGHRGRRFGAQGPSAPCFSGSCGALSEPYWCPESVRRRDWLVRCYGEEAGAARSL